MCDAVVLAWRVGVITRDVEAKESRARQTIVGKLIIALFDLVLHVLRAGLAAPGLSHMRYAACCGFCAILTQDL